MKERIRKEKLREFNQRQWMKEEPHKNRKKYNRKDRRKYKKIDDGET